MLEKQICENCKWWKEVKMGLDKIGTGDCKSQMARSKVILSFRTRSDFGCIFWELK